jgi:DNA-binding transcriptional LysR family regulator
MVDLGKGDVDVAIRYLAHPRAPDNATFLFGERFTPVASPALVKRGPKLARPADLAHHVLVHYDDAEGRTPWINWSAWLAANGAPDLKPAGMLRFSLYDQVIQAAIAGQGVALGRIPLISGVLERGQLVAPFAKRDDAPRGYYAIPAPHAQAQPEVLAFIEWLAAESARVAGNRRKPRR